MISITYKLVCNNCGANSDTEYARGQLTGQDVDLLRSNMAAAGWATGPAGDLCRRCVKAGNDARGKAVTP